MTNNSDLHRDNRELKTYSIIMAVALGLLTYLANDKLNTIVQTGSDNKINITSIKSDQAKLSGKFETLSNDLNRYQKESEDGISEAEARLIKRIEHNELEFNTFSAKGDRVTPDDLKHLRDEIDLQRQKIEFENERKFQLRVD